MRKLVSIGGWCGPALILGKLGLRTEAYPFDFSRVTLDGVAHFTRHGFDDGFFPPGAPPYRPECVGIWVLFRGQHTAFAHFDLNDPKIHDAFRRKQQRWDEMITGPQPVTFFRTVAARRVEDELKHLPALEAALRWRNPALDYRIVLTAHDQGLEATTQLHPISDRVALWALEYTAGPERTLFDRSHEGYAEIVAAALDDEQWPPRAGPAPLAFKPERLVELQAQSAGGDLVVGNTAATFPWRPHDNIALIDGVASVGGTCTGADSTAATAVRDAEGHDAFHCPHCGDSTGHRAGKPFRSGREFTEEDDELLLVHLYKVLQGGDRVEAIEQLAHELGRGAFEVICRLQFLTNNSTKITEGLEPVDD